MFRRSVRAGRLITALYARIVRVAVPTLDADAAHEAADVFAQVRQHAWRRSFAAWLLVWGREAAALLTTARVERQPQATAIDALPESKPLPLARLVAELRLAARQLARTPVSTLVAAGSIAVALAGVISIFALGNSLLWRPLPGVTAPERLVRVLADRDPGVWSYPHFELVTGHRRTLQGAAAYADSPVVVAAGEAAPRSMLGVSASANIFDVLGVSPLVGRVFTKADGDDVAVVGHGFWTRELHGRHDVIGSTIMVSSRPATVVGVLPPGLTAISAPVEAAVWLPIAADVQAQAGLQSLAVIARLSDGATVRQAQAELEAAGAALVADGSLPRDPGGNTRTVSVLSEVAARIPRGDRGAVMAGLGGVLLLAGLVLAVACANVGNMTLARVAARRTEIAVRMAIGAGRGHILGLIVAESLVLATLSGAMAVFLTLAVVRYLDVASATLGIPPGIQLAVDWRVLTFASLTALATTLVCGLVPAAQAARTNVQANLQSGQPAAAGGPGRARRALLAAQVAGSATFAVLAVLFMRSVTGVHEVELGFDPDPVAVVTVDAERQRDAAARLARLRERLTPQLASDPGVDAFAFASAVPMSGFRMRATLDAIEGTGRLEGGPTYAMTMRVSPGYFRVVGMPLLAGRDFTDRDAATAPQVAIVNQAFADRYWPGGSALGKRIGASEIVGVVANAQLESLSQPPAPHLFQPIDQGDYWRVVVHARTSGDPVALAQRVQRSVTAIDGTLVAAPDTMRAAMVNAYLLPQVMLWAFTAAGVLSTTLATVGLYGVMSYLVGLRRREFGVRTALGASPSAITRMVLREGVGLLGVGLAAGVGLAVGVAWLLRAQLVGVAPLDPVAIGTSVALLVVAALLASVVPAWQAGHLDPIQALRP